ncbi:MAG: phosphomannomutase [Proteobacteria bacterium SG_bin7]|nr:MAG: phosphomannomutase [Proteobacteria bacterium SG_bin7]
MAIINPEIYREYDIRGIYQKDFDTDFAELLGRAHISYIVKKFRDKNPKVTVGHDARLSSPEIYKSLIKGMMESGAHVVRLGLIATPISYFSTFKLENIAGAIMITGSHNPPEYNGFKISVGNQTIYGSDIQILGKIIKERDFVNGSGSVSDLDILSIYVEHYKKEFHFKNDIKVVVDAANGAAGCVVRRLYEGVGLNPAIIFEEPDGRFPNHHPDPTVEKNMKQLREKVLSEKAVIGIGFDGDSDRIGLIDHEGRMIYGDEIMAIASRDILQRHHGATIIGDVKCSDRLYADIKKCGGNGIMWKTGHSLIKSKIKESKAPFGGEFSGHIFFADRNFGYDDAMYAGLRIVEIMAKTKKTIPQLLENFGEAYNTPEIRIDTTEEKKMTVVNKLREFYPKKGKGYSLNEIDGIRLSFDDGWALVRPSNTQPVVVLRFEANTKSGLERIQGEIQPRVESFLND